MALLDIIVTHWHEKWSVCRTFFEMLRMQRGADWNDARVILVQDGEDEELDLDRIMRVYPFVEQLVTIPHSGVSAARNEGLRAAESEWVMFCDIDDCVYSADGLFRIIQSLKEAGDLADLVWSNIWIEMGNEPGATGWHKKLKGWNTVFIHGKCYRREFLLDHGILFSEELCYSEDAMFNAIVMMEIDQKRIAKMPETVYMWCYRQGSASNYAGGDARRNLSLYRKRVMLSEAFEERGRKYDAKAAAVRTLLDYYWELNGQDECQGHSREEWIQRLKEDVISRWPDAVTEISPADRKELLRITREEAKAKKLIREGMPAPEEWLREIGAV